jgi:dipeptidyl aminopeptidase/acylaminoacyl peptidase
MLLLLAAAAPAGAQAPARQRPFTIDDLLAIEGLGTVTLSPDGAWVAAVVQRRQSPQEQFELGWLGGNVRGDIWLVHPDGTGRRNLTKGVATGTGYWDPVWSPDGSHLALLSIHGASVHVWVWSRAGDSLRQVVTRPVDNMVLNETGEGGPFQPIAWLDASTLLVPLLPSSEGLGLPTELAAQETATRYWALARRGETPTSSRLDAGLASSYQFKVREELVALNVTSGAMKVVGTIPITTTTSGERSFHLSPDRRTVAILTSRSEPPDPNQRLSRGMVHAQVGLAATDGRGAVRWLDSLQGYLSPDFGVTLRWSPDGSRLLVVGRQSSAGDTTVRVFSVGARDGVTAPLLPAEWESAEATPEEDEVGLHHVYKWKSIWAPESGPVVLARRPGGRRDWWLARGPSAPYNLTASLPRVPQVLIPGILPHTAVTLDEAGLGVLDTRTGTLSYSSPDTSGAGSWQLLWPSEASLENRASRVLVLGRATERGGSELVEADLGSLRPRFTRIGELPVGYRVVGYDPRSHAIVAGEWNREIVALRGEHRTTLLEVNPGAGEIAIPERRLISYRSTDGDSLKAVAVLPIGYVPGKRYPVVTWVYAGDVYATVNDGWVGTVSPLATGAFNLLQFPSRGYVLLFPSIPLAPSGGVGTDMREEIAGGVLPAVDKLVELGIADPARISVMGQSFGGYSTLSLITSTRRFRTAIAFSSLADYISMYGTFRFWDRYHADSHLALATPKMAEAGQDRLGSTPWGNLGRYLKDSPLFYVDRVTTPVLLVQGDQNDMPIENVEEFFTALHRLGKRARFVRYWGEGHVLYSPANIRDMWQQVFEWLDETMPAATPPPS